MALKNIFNILVDLKIVRSINQPLVTQNDSVVFILEVMDNGVPFDLTDTTTISLAHTRKDGTVVVTPGTKVGNIATFELGTNETAVAGGVIAKAQFYDADGRVSTLSFGYQVGQDPTGSGYVPSEVEQTLIQVVMADAQAKIDELSAVDVVVLNQQLADTVTLANKVEGSLNDTTQIQNAINSASLGSGRVKLQKGKIYIVGTLIPKENVTIDLNGSTLKLRDNTNYTVFYEVAAKATKSKNFGVINGIIDANMQNNNLINQSAGVFWMKDWDGLFFDKLLIKNAFRNIFNFFSCHNIKIPTVLCDGNGMTNAGNFYSYGATFEPGCKNIEIGNFSVINMYGFGIHFYDVENFTADNLIFENITHPSAIAVTFTKAKRGRVNNIICKNVLGDSIEINASTDVVVENLVIDFAGKRPIIFGDNGTALFNERVKLSNVKVTNTGGAESISVNWAKNCEVSFGDFDKGLSTLANLVTENFRFIDTKFNVSLSSVYLYFSKFRFINTRFANIVLQRVENTIFEYGSIGKTITMIDTAIIEIPFANFEKESGMIGGKLQIVSSMPGNSQGNYQEVAFIQYATTLNISEKITLDGSFGRKLTVTSDAPNKKIILTNSTGQTLFVKWNVIGL